MKARGFTLVELVVVIVLLGITAVTFTRLIINSVQGYLDTANRQDSVAMARLALDRIARDLREAMPQSIRLSSTGNGNCLQFLPINSSFVYTSFNSNNTIVYVIEPFGGAVVPGSGFYAAINPVNSDDLYSTTAMKAINSFGSVSAGLRNITLASGFAAPRSGPGERLYVLGNPVSYCFTNNQLLRYTSAVTAAQPTPGSGLSNGAIMLDKLPLTVSAPSSFTYGSGNWQNNALVTILLTIQQASSNNEQLQLDHEVWLRNVQ